VKTRTILLLFVVLFLLIGCSPPSANLSILLEGNYPANNYSVNNYHEATWIAVEADPNSDGTFEVYYVPNPGKFQIIRDATEQGWVEVNENHETTIHLLPVR
jgi:hypothetical protein